ncbi:MAG: FHA domain-containing protein [Myxococcaceae bacterium]|nr:FHA domain-containing protein [Myxococcaceae bacterium]
MKLIIEDDEGRKTVVPFVRDEITIGRQEGNTIRLTERNVSRRHARLLRQNGHILVEDLGSYNGIRINGDRIQGQVQVNEGDLIQIGDYDLAVQREASEAAAAAAPNHNDKTQEVEAIHTRSNGVGANGTARHAAHAKDPSPDGATIPVLPTIDPGATMTGEEPEEADPNDVTLQPQPAPSEEAQATARRQSTAIIRMDQVEQNRPRQIADIDATDAPRLIILNTELAGREYSCVRTELKVGRTDENDIAIDHRSLSRTHCKIVREDSGEWRVIDMQSANGLMVNGESYAQSALRHGDVLELGHVKMKFVGAGEKYDARDAVNEAAGGGKTGVMIAVAVVALCVIAGGGFAYMKYGRGSGQKLPPPVVDTNPKNPKVEAPQPEELTPEQQRAQIESKLKEAREKIDGLDWAGASEILKTCYVGESLHPEAQRLLVALKEEEALRAALEKAEQLIEQDKLSDAKEALESAQHTKFLTKRYNEVLEKLNKATERKLLQAKAPEQVKPTPVQQPQPVAVKTPPPPQPAAKTGADLLEEARAFNKNKEFVKGKTQLEKCIKLEPKNAQCWKLMGVTLGQLGDGSGGARAYEKFLELAPDDPQAPKVRAILEAFRSPK